MIQNVRHNVRRFFWFFKTVFFVRTGRTRLLFPFSIVNASCNSGVTGPGTIIVAIVTRRRVFVRSGRRYETAVVYRRPIDRMFYMWEARALDGDEPNRKTTRGPDENSVRENGRLRQSSLSRVVMANERLIRPAVV